MTSRKNTPGALKKTADFTARQLYKFSKFSAKHLGNVLVKYSGNGSTLEGIVGSPNVIKHEPKRKVYRFDNSYSPNLYDLTRYFKSQGVIGEESVCLLSALGLIQGNSVIIRGSAGSGKTMIQDALFDLIPENLYYKLGYITLSALMKDGKRINSAYTLFVPELQKVMGNKDLQEAFKDISNGDPFRSTISSPAGHIRELLIRGDLSINTSMADQNSFRKVFDSHTEAYRRFIHLYTRTQGNITAEVLKSKALQDSDPLYSAEQLSQPDLKKLGNHMAAAITNRDFKFINPFAEYLAERAPDQNEMISSFIDHYRNLIKAHTKFNIQNRVKAKNNGDVIVFCTLEDVQRIHQLYSSHFSRSLTEIKGQPVNLDTFFNVDWQECLDYGLNVMSSRYNSVTNDWLQRQSAGDHVLSLDPTNGVQEAVAEYKPTVDSSFRIRI